MKKAIIITISVLVVLLGAGVALWFFTPVFDSLKPASENFSIQAKKLFGAKKVSSYADYIASIEPLKAEQKSYVANANISANVTLPSSMVDYSTQRIINNTQISWEGSFDDKSKASSSKVKLNYNNSEMLNLKAVVDGKKVTLSSKDLYDKALTFDLDKFKAFCKSNNLDIKDEDIDKIEKMVNNVPGENSSNILYDLLYLTEDEYKALNKDYGNILKKIIDEDKYSTKKNQKITVDGDEIKATGYSLTVSGKDLCKYLKKLSEDAKDNDNVKSILVKKINLLKKYMEPVAETGLDSYSKSSVNTSGSLALGLNNSTSSATSEVNSMLNKDVEKSDIEKIFDEIIESLEESEEAFSSIKQSVKFTIYADKKKNPVRFDIAIVKDKEDDGNVIFIEEVQKGKNTYTIDVKELSKVIEKMSSDDSSSSLRSSSSSSLSSYTDSLDKIVIVDKYEETDTSRKGTATVSVKAGGQKQELATIEYEIVNSKSEMKNNFKISSSLLSAISVDVKMEATGLDTDKQDFKFIVDASVPVGYSTAKVKLNVDGSIEYGKSDIESYSDSNSIDVFSKSTEEILKIYTEVITKASDILPSKLSNFGIKVTKDDIMKYAPQVQAPAAPATTETTEAIQPAA